jgi:ADP-ribose pyrophosphatase YjhB (NUDIX family)
MQWKPNVTVAAIIQDQDRFLLVEENADDLIVFNQPAGHLEKDETLVEAVKREVLEETAWHFHPAGLSGIYHYYNPQNGITYLRFCFYGTCDRFEENRELDNGILRTVWMTAGEIRSRPGDMRSPMVEKCVDDYLSGKTWPLDILHSFPGNQR